MKRRIIHPAAVALALLAIATLPACRSVQALPGQWLDVSAAADGRPDDFSRKITSHLFENGMMVGTGNDDRYLYVFFSPDIHRQQRPAGRATLTLWLDEAGGRAKRLGLVLLNGPAPPAGQQGRSPAGEARPEMPGGDRREQAAPPGPPPGTQGQALLKIVDRRTGREAFIVADGSLGPAVRLASDWGDLSYQLRVPLQATANGDWPGLRLEPGQPLGIGIIWRIEPPAGSPGKGHAGPSRDGLGPGGEGEGMGPPAGGMAGGPGRGMPGQNAPRKRAIWLKSTLANR